MKKLLLILLLAVSTQSMADSKVKLTAYIQPNEYEYPVRLLNYAYYLWVEQGPLVESAARKTFSPMGSGFAMCSDKPEEGNLFLWLRPNVFYNPLMTTYYGKVQGYFYTADGKPLLRLIGESRVNGMLSGDVSKPVVAAAFDAAMNDLYQQMQSNSQVQDYLQGKIKGQVTLNPCATANLLPSTKFKANAFQ
jgi:hypothetical protein